MGGDHSCRVLGNPCTQTPQGSSSKVLLPHSNPHPALFPHPHVWPTLQVPDGHSTSYPSLLSHLTSTSLNAPALALPVAKRQPPDPGLRSFHPLASSPPCDFHLLNLRTLQAEVSVLLHPMLSGPKSGLSSSDSSLSQGHLLDNTSVLSFTQDDTLPSAEAALILHRKGFDCGLEAKNLGFNCTTSQGKVSRAQVWEGSS